MPHVLTKKNRIGWMDMSGADDVVCGRRLQPGVLSAWCSSPHWVRSVGALWAPALLLIHATTWKMSCALTESTGLPSLQLCLLRNGPGAQLVNESFSWKQKCGQYPSPWQWRQQHVDPSVFNAVPITAHLHCRSQLPCWYPIQYLAWAEII